MVKGLFSNLTPCIPLSFLRRGGSFIKRGVSPLLDDPKIGESKRGEASLIYNYSPFPLSRGRGVKGDGVTR